MLNYLIYCREDITKVLHGETCFNSDVIRAVNGLMAYEENIEACHRGTYL